jgi:hypothetical protein
MLRGAAVAANLSAKVQMRTRLWGVSRVLVFPGLFGHCFGGLPAPCGNSLFCFGYAALRVTVSLEVLFGKCAEKICPDPP